MEACCNLGKELTDKKNVVYETDNFFVVPAVGQIGIEGYVLICSKEHFIGVGDIPEKFERELETVVKKTKNKIAKVYNSEIIVFEHGPRLDCHKGGGCLDHAHLHVVPTKVSVANFLKKDFKIKKCPKFSYLRRIFKKRKSSYLFIESQDGKRYFTETKVPIPSQYLRQIIAFEMGVANWDWRLYPDKKTFENTVKNLRTKSW